MSKLRKGALWEKLEAMDATSTQCPVFPQVTAAKMAKLPSFKLKLLCGSWLDVVKKPRHQQAFDAITLSTHVAYLCADPRINQLLKKRAVVGVETAKFLVELRAENRKEYASKLNACALALGWKGRKAQVDGVADACLWCVQPTLAPPRARPSVCPFHGSLQYTPGLHVS